MQELSSYKTAIFDCDGVLLDSNRVKSDACQAIAANRDPSMASEFVTYHQQNAGVSRFEKMRYLHEVLLKTPAKTLEDEISQDIEAFGETASKLLNKVDITLGTVDFLDRLPQSTSAFVVSGGKQSEVRSVLESKGLDKYFLEIFGSPRPKTSILNALRDQKKLPKPGIYFGDSKYDYEMAELFQLDFVFVKKYTEFEDWEEFFSDKNVTLIETFSDLL